MRLSASPFVVQVWMPIMFILGAYLFFHGMAPEYWLIGVPLLLIPAFMCTLAEVQDQGHRIQVRRLWHSIDVPKEDVATISQSFVEGIGVLRLRRFVPPWGRVYFVTDWSKLGVASPGSETERTNSRATRYSLVRRVLESLVVAISGFVAARAITAGVHDFRLQTSAMRIAAAALVGALCVLFAVARARKPSFANVVLFVATFIAGLALR